MIDQRNENNPKKKGKETHAHDWPQCCGCGVSGLQAVVRLGTTVLDANWFEYVADNAGPGTMKYTGWPLYPEVQCVSL